MHPQRVGIVGVPPLSIISELNRNKCLIFDLDEPQIKKSIDFSSQYLPKVYCAILRTVVLNALHLELDVIYIDVGPGKCDCALHVAMVLEDLVQIPIIKTRNLDTKSFGTSLCRTQMPLLDKFTSITKAVQSDSPGAELSPCTPDAGFWGVPPAISPFSLCFRTPLIFTAGQDAWKNKTPANLELETHYNPNIPTVFFAQSFCAKAALAHHLDRLHPKSLFLDCDVTAGNSTRAKIEAFLELSGVKGKRINN